MVQEPTNPQRAIDMQIQELVEMSRRRVPLERAESDSQWLGEFALERRIIGRATGYFGRWLSQVQVVLPLNFDAESEDRLFASLTGAEYAQILELDMLVRGFLNRPQTLSGQEIWLTVEIAIILSEQDVQRSRECAALLRKAGFWALPTIAGTSLSEAARAAIEQTPTVVILDGHLQGWDETLTALYDIG